MKCLQHPLGPLHIHAPRHTHDATTPHSMQHSAQPTHSMLQHMCTHPTNQQTLPNHQPVNRPTSQPASQPAKLSSPRTNQPTTNQPTQKTDSQPANKPSPTAQGGGGGSITWEEGGTKHTTAPHSTAPDRAAVQQTPQAHTAGRSEGLTHLPANACPCAATFQMHKSHTCRKETDTVPHLRPNKQVSPSTNSATWRGGR